MNLSLIAMLAKRVIVVCVVALIGWHATHFGRSSRGKAIVHVSHQKDVVTIDNHTYWVESVEKPLSCELESGKHVLRIKRDQLLIAEEVFMIEPGKELILTPRDSTEFAAQSTPPTADLEAANSRGRAIRTVRFRRPLH